MPMEMGNNISWMASVVRLVTGLDPEVCFASFSVSTEKLARAVMMPPMVIAMCSHAKNVLSLAVARPRVD